MNLIKLSLLAFFLIVVCSQGQTQSIDAISTPFSIFDEPQFSAILYNGEIVVQDDSPDGPLMLNAGTGGMFSVATIDRSFKDSIKDYQIMKPIAFKIAILDYRTNTMTMYSDETYFEIDLDKLSQALGAGDKIIFMPAEIKYALPRHELMLDGC